MRDRSSIWIGLADLLLCVLSVVIVAVAPKEPARSGVQEKAEYLITMESSPDIDADPDLWLITPSKKPLFYGSRDVGCAKLDGDPRGFMDNVATLADGSKVKVETEKETVSLRCIEPGRYDVGVNLYAFREKGATQLGALHGPGLKVHVEIVAVNPNVHVVFAKDVTLDRVGQTINVESFDLSRQGEIALTEPPRELVTANAYSRAGP
ncbi:MAG TPA: hypothetical protein VJY34_07610 [Roseiarcus sp.]|nr:hypothetical protein [Roseiarcus sp.]